MFISGWGNLAFAQQLLPERHQSKLLLVKSFVDNLPEVESLKGLFPPLELIQTITACESGNLLWSIIQSQHKILEQNPGVFKNIETQLLSEVTLKSEVVPFGVRKDNCLFLQQIEILDVNIEVQFTTDEVIKRDSDVIQVLQVNNGFYLLSL